MERFLPTVQRQQVRGIENNVELQHRELREKHFNDPWHPLYPRVIDPLFGREKALRLALVGSGERVSLDGRAGVGFTPAAWWRPLTI